MSNRKKTAPEVSRRQFFGSACCAAVGATGLLSTLGSLRLMGAVASPANGPQPPSRAGAHPSDYKALVCLFLNGGKRLLAGICSQPTSPWVRAA